jgi:glutaredoxin-like protein DUF836
VEAAPAVLTLLGKPDCHLCHVMAEVTRRAAAGLAATLVERDVREDPALYALYGNDIPVLLLGAREVARHRVNQTELRTRLLGMGVRVRPG